jgi:hypothetical protein
MRGFAFVLLTTLVGMGMTIAAPKAEAQVEVNIGPPPVCPYGYFPDPPYQCAPYGYYGPEWFEGGIFIGAGPWFHGPHDFHGYVDNHFRPDHGYHGRLPERGERAEHGRVNAKNFHGNELRDTHGSVVHESREEHARHEKH